MSIYYSGSLRRSGGIINAISKQVNLLNLKPIKKIQVQFDPFHPNAVTARDFLYYISSTKVLATNLSCIIKPVVVCDRSEPQIKINLEGSGSIKFLANNLTVLEILQQINKHVSSKVPKEEPSTAQVGVAKLQTKKQKRK